MDKLSLQTKSFIWLFAFVVVGSYVCLMLWGGLLGTSSTTYNNAVPQTISQNNLSGARAGSQQLPRVDTSNWKSYTDRQDGLSFLYKPGWKVLPPQNKNGFRVLQVDPGIKYYNIKIYISPAEFYIMDGLPTTTDTVGGKSALNANNALYGVVAGNLHYTFDVGLSMSLLADFNALVRSVRFQ